MSKKRSVSEEPPKQSKAERSSKADSTPRVRKRPKNDAERPHSLFAKSPTEHLGKAPTLGVVGVPRCLGEELWVREIALGQGTMALEGSKVSVLYTARLHSTRKRFDHRTNPNLPFIFNLGKHSRRLKAR